MKTFLKTMAAGSLIAALPALAACAQSGTDEEATAEANAMGNDLQDSVGEMGESMESSASDMGDAVEDSADEAGDAVKDATNDADSQM